MPFTQLRLQHFALGTQRQLADEVHVLRHLESRDALAAMCNDSLSIERRSIRQHDERGTNLSPSLIRYADDRRLPHAG
jgi:hypothetical protein